jgi:hypothetical protein
VIVRLDGVTLEVEATTNWVEQAGTSPYVLDLEVDRDTAEGLFDNAEVHGSALSLEDGLRTHDQKRLTIIGLSPTANPNTTTLRLTDPRWAFPYVFVARHYNVRRKTPLVRRSEPRGSNLPPDAASQTTVVSDDVAYAPYSLNLGLRAWLVIEVATDILDLVVGAGNWRDRDNVLSTSTVQVEGWIFNFQGDAAIAALMGYLGGAANTFVDDEGKLVLYDTQNEGEVAQLGLPAQGTTRTRADEAGLRPIVGSQLFELQNRVMERPEKVRVYFDRFMEARINASESDPTGASNTTRTRQQAELLRCVNVIPLPEDGTINGRAVVQGTWVSLDDYILFLAENTTGNPLAERLPLTRERIRKLWLSNAINSYSAPQLDPSGLWAVRIAQLRAHYRRTYRVTKKWNDRIKSYQANRVGIEDYETGSRAPALAFLDYCVVRAWTPLGAGYDTVDDEIWQLTANRYASPLLNNSLTNSTPIIDNSLRDLQAAPAKVTIVDQDLGILRVELVTDFTGVADRYVRSATVTEEGGRADFRARKLMLADTDLTVDHEVSILLTIAVGAPNDRRRFHAIDVTVGEAEAQLTPTLTRSVAGKGPILELYVRAPRAVARFPWNDDIEAEFLAAFDAAGTDLNLPNLGDPVNLGELTSVAKAYALAEFIRFRDHNEGGLTTDYRPATIAGSVDRVVHSFTREGALTTVELASTPSAVDAQALLPPDVRRMIEGYVEP